MTSLRGGRLMVKEWMVLLEAAADDVSAAIDNVAFRRLVTAWGAPPPTGLYSPSRYALQVPVRASDPGGALAAAMGLWTDAVRRARIPEWELVRAEIVTLDEYERDFLEAQLAASGEDGAARAGSSPPDPASDDLLLGALHDPVTGLPDRELFLDEVRAALAVGSRSALQAVMVVDVDVDGDGDRRDDLLVELAARVKDAVRGGDVVARVGPARFALLVTVRSGEDTAVVAARVVDHVRSTRITHGKAVTATARVGVADVSLGVDADELLRSAEAAVAAARGAAGNRPEQVGAHSDGA